LIWSPFLPIHFLGVSTEIIIEQKTGKKEFFVEEIILHGGIKELEELKKTLQERARYNAVLDSLDNGVDEQRLKIEKREKEIELEMNEEIKRRREDVVKPFYSEIAISEMGVQQVKDEKSKRRQELIDQMIEEEVGIYERKLENLEKQIKLLKQEEGVPYICTTRLFLAFFCPRTGKDALILVGGLVFLLLVLPMLLYFGVYGGNDQQMLMAIYLVLIVFFYTIYLLINNLVKDKYLLGINKLLKLMEECEKLEAYRKKRLKELENIPDSSLDLNEFDEEIGRLETEIVELNRQRDLALVNFDSDEQLQIEIGKQVKERYRLELEQMNNVLQEAISTYSKMQKEYNDFLDEKNLEGNYDQLIRLEPGIFSTKVIDELIFFITHGGAENIRDAIMMRNKKKESGDTSEV